METIFVKNMVCSRCVMAVQHELDKLDIPYHHVLLGEIGIESKLSDDAYNKLNEVLIPLGFEIIDNKKQRIIEKIKNHIIQMVRSQKGSSSTNLSVQLSDELHYDYNYLSTLFSEVEGSTIEKYYIAQKIERIKELLVYDEMSLGEIADLLGYSSAAYLSNQFKKETGLTPGHFKKIGNHKRKSLDQL